MTNSYNQFEWNKAADYSPLLKQRAAETNRGFELAQEQERENQKARVENAKQFDRMIDTMEKFSATAGRALKQYRDERDQRHRNLSQELQHKTGASWIDLTRHNAEWEKGNKDQGYLNHLANEAEAKGDHTSARLLRGLTGSKERIFKQTLLQQAAVSYETDLEDAKKANFEVTLDDGTKLKYNDIKDDAEWDEWQRGYNVAHKFTETSWANQEFLAKNFWPTFNKVTTKAKAEWGLNHEANQKYELNQQIDNRLELAAKTNTLGSVVHDIMQANKSDYNKDSQGRVLGDAGVRLHIRDRLIHMVKTGEITREQFNSLYDYEFYHDGDRKNVTLGKFTEFDQEKINFELTQAEQAQYVARAQAEKNRANIFVQDLQKKMDEEGRLLDEEEARATLKIFNDAFPNLPKSDRPPFINDLLNRTQEDRADEDLVANMQANLNEGLPIGDDWKYIKGSEELKDEWRKKAQSPLGQGLDPTETAKSHKAIEAEVKLALGMTMGVSETDTPRYLRMVHNAKVKWASFYRDAEFDDPKQKALYADEQVRNLISQNIESLNVIDRVTPEQSYRVKVNQALTALENSVKSGAATFDTLLPGTEADFKLLEVYAANPTTTGIPPIYRHIANTPVGQKQSPPWTAWSIANAQYKSQTGKELPKPNSQLRFEKKDPIVQYLLTRYPNYYTVRQAVVRDKQGGDFSTEEITTPGVTQQ